MTKRLNKPSKTYQLTFLNDKSVKLNAQNEYECTNYGIITKPYRAKLNDQIAKIVTFS